MKVKWGKELELGIAEIDDQHKMLIQMLENTYDACSRGEGIKYITEEIEYLKWYVHKHFSDEEKIQRRYSYPKYEEHCKIHQKYKEELSQLANEMQQEDITTEHISKVVAYLTNVIEVHIAGEDRILAHYIKHHELYKYTKVNQAYKRSEMTGLVVKDELDKLIQEKLSEEAERFIYVTMKLDGFNDVNRTYGYEIGNEALIYVSGILKQYESDTCMIAHSYQDTFLMYMAIDDPLEVDSRLESIAKKIYDGFKRKGSIIPLSMTMGIVRGQQQEDLKDIEQKADIALGVARSMGKNVKVYYDESMHQAIARRLDIINMLQPHSLGDYLYVVYQPIYSLKTGEVKGCEALLRMHDADGNSISPMEFIPLAEHNNLITDIGYFCMNEVCKTYSTMACVSDALQYISVNLAIQQLDDPKLVEHMDVIAKGHGIDLSRVYFELTESAMIENIEQMKEIIEQLRSSGSKVLLDDFGTGYSALSYLSRIAVDIIKIDKSFLKDIDTNRGASIILRDMIKMIQSLGMSVVVEGIESEDELTHLHALGANSIQGYYISKPIEREQLCETIQAINQRTILEA